MAENEKWVSKEPHPGAQKFFEGDIPRKRKRKTKKFVEELNKYVERQSNAYQTHAKSKQLDRNKANHRKSKGKPKCIQRTATGQHVDQN